MVEVDEHGTQVVHVPLAEHDKVIETFLADRLDESLDERHRIRRADRGLLDAQTSGFERLVESRGELGVIVMHYNVGTKVRLLHVPEKCFGLLLNPGLVRKIRGRRQEHAPRFHVQEHQYEQIADSLRREHALGEEVALPECGCMNLQEFVPGAEPALRAWIVAVRLQDVFHCVPGHGSNVEFPELAEDAGKSPSVLSGQLQDDGPDVGGRGAASALRRAPFSRSAILSDPAADRVGMDDRRQLVERASQLGSESRQPVALLRRDVHNPRQLAPQDLVLNLEVADVPGELLLCGAGNEEQQRSVNVAHGTVRWKSGADREMALFLHPAVPRKMVRRRNPSRPGDASQRSLCC